jgi:hypothetical protein
VVAGAVCWVLAILYLVAQPIVAAGFSGRSYSFRDDSISDLGNSECAPFQAPYGPREYVCSPWHVWMNVAIVAGAVLTIAGAGLTWRWWQRRKATAAGLWCVAAAGVGGILVGFAPENTNVWVHAIGSLLQLPGVVGMLLLGIGMPGPISWARWFSLVWGAIAAAATVLFISNIYLALGPGGIERVAYDSLTVWTVVIGALILSRPVPSPR